MQSSRQVFECKELWVARGNPKPETELLLKHNEPATVATSSVPPPQPYRCNFLKSGAPGGIRTPDPLLRSYAIQNSKCRFWCRLRGSASFISLLNWTEVGLKLPEVEAPAAGVELQWSVCLLSAASGSNNSIQFF
jgi:hypothetical protein